MDSNYQHNVKYKHFYKEPNLFTNYCLIVYIYCDRYHIYSTPHTEKYF